MHNFKDMLWIETIKAIRSKMPLWTVLGSLFMPFGMAFLIFVARNPEISSKLGLVSAKANLMNYAATNWSSYLMLFGEVIAAGGFILYVLILSWVFGREFVDGTLKDLLAVPVERGSLLLAKFTVAAVWSMGVSLVIFLLGLATGWLIELPGGSAQVILQGLGLDLFAAVLIILTVFPFALLASVGRGYLLPFGGAVILLMFTNFIAIAGWGEFFPWAIPGLFVQGKAAMNAASLSLVIGTGLAGAAATYFWWKYADQSR